MVGDWRISVAEVDTDAADTILAENQFNDPPAAGHSFVMVTIEATFEGAEASDPWFDVRNKALGDSRVAYEGFDAYCGVIPDDFTNVGEVQPGETVFANFCWSVADEDIENLILILEDSGSFDEGRLFYALG